ncbi:uncharacterized protein C8R40DRAFT_24029 [Lentinula edodes]|uniref:uncharacterized protein n=1 Tax=Lentinula edodes TaxID=5353 RepID=UPI001E8D2D84|nr:uncharacterized protein C8R40DRAFT_24029 [Lentinula edodes]KAH7881193.1 hypothetical protein C8R40DRAFT_24029 [Lentinula edodes]
MSTLVERDMSGYHSNSEFTGVRAPRKPLLKNVALPANSPINSPTVSSFPRSNESTRTSRFPWVSAHLLSRSQTPAPPPTRRPNPSFHEVATPAPGTSPHTYQDHRSSSRTRKTSVSSNISDRSNVMAPLKGILKKTGSSSRSSTPAPTARKGHVPPTNPEPTMHAISTSSGESASGHRYHHRRTDSKTSSSSSSKMDGYSSDSHMLWKRKVSHDGDGEPSLETVIFIRPTCCSCSYRFKAELRG